MSNTQASPTPILDTINAHYQKKIMNVFKHMLKQHTRLFVNRIDLRFPQVGDYKSDSRVISRFFDSLKAQLNAREKRKQKVGKRVHPHGIEYVWVREMGPKSQKPHYHIVLFFNKDAFFTLGKFDVEKDNLYAMIVKAWNSGLGIKKDTKGLIHFCNFSFHHLDKNDNGFEEQYNAWLGYLDYLAKDFSKPYGDGRRSFGCSR